MGALLRVRKVARLRPPRQSAHRPPDRGRCVSSSSPTSPRLHLARRTATGPGTDMDMGLPAIAVPEAPTPCCCAPSRKNRRTPPPPLPGRRGESLRLHRDRKNAGSGKQAPTSPIWNDPLHPRVAMGPAGKWGGGGGTFDVSLTLSHPVAPCVRLCRPQNDGSPREHNSLSLSTNREGRRGEKMG